MIDEELIACIQAEIRGEEIEYAVIGGTEWKSKYLTEWDMSNFKYRIKAKAPVLVPYYAAICRNNGGYFTTDYLYTSEEEAKKRISSGFVELDTKYPRMLEVRNDN